MPYGDYGNVTLYDLFAPINHGQMGYEPYDQQYGTNVGQFVDPNYGANPQTPGFAGPEQPQKQSFLTSLADRFAGTDRYSDLSEGSKRRALGEGMMSFGQSLLQAGLAPDYRGVGQALAGAIPQAYGTIQSGLRNEDKMRQERDAEAFQKEQRAHEKKTWGDEEERRRREQAAFEESVSAAKDIATQQIQLAERWRSEHPEDAKKPEAEAAFSDLQAKSRALFGAMRLGKPLSGEQLGSLGSSMERLAKVFGEEDSLKDAAAKAMYTEAAKAGVLDDNGLPDVKAWAAKVKEEKGIKLDSEKLRKATLYAAEQKRVFLSETEGDPQKKAEWEAQHPGLTIAAGAIRDNKAYVNPNAKGRSSVHTPADKLSKEMELEAKNNGGPVTTIIRAFEQDPKKVVDTQTALTLAPFGIPGVELGKPLPKSTLKHVLSTVGASGSPALDENKVRADYAEAQAQGYDGSYEAYKSAFIRKLRLPNG